MKEKHASRAFGFSAYRWGWGFLHIIVFMLLPSLSLFGQKITLLTGSVRMDKNQIMILPELIVYDEALPVSVRYWKPLGLGDISAWTLDGKGIGSICEYIEGRPIAHDDMKKIWKRIQSMGPSLSPNWVTHIKEGGACPFLMMRTPNQDWQIRFESPRKDNALVMLLDYYRRNPVLSKSGEFSLGSPEVEAITIKFHEVAQRTDLNFAYRIHLISEADMKELGITPDYFGKIHHYDDERGVNQWVGVFVSADYYLVGDRVFLADLDVQFKGMQDCREWIKRKLEEHLKNGQLPGRHN